MDEMRTVYHEGKEYWYYNDDIISWWDGAYDGDTYEQPRYVSAMCDDGPVTIEFDEDGNVLDVSCDF
jgi:hypothetical protein